MSEPAPDPGSPATIDPAEVVICTIHGNGPGYRGSFARKYPWPELQLRQLRRFTPAGFRVFAFGNDTIPEHDEFFRAQPDVTFFSSNEIQNSRFARVWPLRNWLTRRAIDRFRWIIHLDSDAFPIAPDWLPRYIGRLTPKCPMVSILRMEDLNPAADRCFTLFSREGFREHQFDFSPVGYLESGGGLSAELEAKGLQWHALTRSNRHDYHPNLAGIFDDHIYHHAAGSRVAFLRTNRERREDLRAMAIEDAARKVLMKRLFADPDAFLAELRGERPPADLDRAIRREAGWDTSPIKRWLFAREFRANKRRRDWKNRRRPAAADAPRG